MYQGRLEIIYTAFTKNLRHLVCATSINPRHVTLTDCFLMVYVVRNRVSIPFQIGYSDNRCITCSIHRLLLTQLPPFHLIAAHDGHTQCAVNIGYMTPSTVQHDHTTLAPIVSKFLLYQTLQPKTSSHTATNLRSSSRGLNPIADLHPNQQLYPVLACYHQRLHRLLQSTCRQQRHLSQMMSSAKDIVATEAIKSCSQETTRIVDPLASI